MPAKEGYIYIYVYEKDTVESQFTGNLLQGSSGNTIAEAHMHVYHTIASPRHDTT
jgi:hypothetical protein